MIQLINWVKKTNPDLFVYERSDVVHPHDRFFAWSILRFFPPSITPNGLTLFRVLATPFVFWLVFVGYYRIGVIAFVLVAFTDALDGSMARTQGKITKFGMLFDPLADKFLIGSMVILLVFQHLNTWLGIAIVGVEVLFILGALVLKAKFKTVKMANRWGKIKMISQVVAVSLIMIALLLDFPLLMSIAAGVFGIAIGFAVLSLFTHGI